MMYVSSLYLPNAFFYPYLFCTHGLYHAMLNAETERVRLLQLATPSHAVFPQPK